MPDKILTFLYLSVPLSFFSLFICFPLYLPQFISHSLALLLFSFSFTLFHTWIISLVYITLFLILSFPLSLPLFFHSSAFFFFYVPLYIFWRFPLYLYHFLSHSFALYSFITFFLSHPFKLSPLFLSLIRFYPYISNSLIHSSSPIPSFFSSLSLSLSIFFFSLSLQHFSTSLYVIWSIFLFFGVFFNINPFQETRFVIYGRLPNTRR